MSIILPNEILSIENLILIFPNEILNLIFSYIGPSSTAEKLKPYINNNDDVEKKKFYMPHSFIDYILNHNRRDIICNMLIRKNIKNEEDDEDIYKIMRKWEENDKAQKKINENILLPKILYSENSKIPDKVLNLIVCKKEPHYIAKLLNFEINKFRIKKECDIFFFMSFKTWILHVYYYKCYYKLQLYNANNKTHKKLNIKNEYTNNYIRNKEEEEEEDARPFDIDRYNNSNKNNIYEKRKIREARIFDEDERPFLTIINIYNKKNEELRRNILINQKKIREKNEELIRNLLRRPILTHELELERAYNQFNNIDEHEVEEYYRANQVNSDNNSDSDSDSDLSSNGDYEY
jgi:hypothetical protein